MVLERDLTSAEQRYYGGRCGSHSLGPSMPLADLEAAQEMAQRKGLPYQTYMKMLLHQALEKERRAS